MKIIISVPEHQAQMLLIPDDIVLHGKDQVAQGSIHGVIIKVFLRADKQKKPQRRDETRPATNTLMIIN